MNEQSIESISNSSFPYELELRLQNFIEDKLIFISSQNSFISYKNDLIFITRLLKPDYILSFDQNSSNIPSFPLTKTSPVIKTSHSSICGHSNCTCIDQFGILSNFASNSNSLVLYFTNNLIITYKITWLSEFDIADNIGVELVKNLEFKAKRGSLSCLALDNSGIYIACSYFDSTTLIYNLDNVYRTFNVKNVVTLMRFNENRLFCSSNQENVIKSFQGHNSSISDFCFLSYNNTNGFISSSYDSIINLYQLDIKIDKDIESESKSPLKQFITSSPVIGINVINSGLYNDSLKTKSPWLILAITENYSFEIIDPLTSQTLRKLTCGINAKRVFFFENFFVVFTNSFELEFYDLLTFRLLYGICCNFDKCYYAKMIPKDVIGSVEYPLLFILNGDEKVRLLTIDNLQIPLYNHKDIVLCVDILLEIIATGSKDGGMMIYDLNLRKKICEVSASQNSIVSIALIRQSGVINIITADYENILKIWSSSGEMLHITVPHKKTINHIAISPNHKMISTSGSDKIIKLFNNRLELLGTCTGHSRSVNYSIFIEKDMVLISASNDSLVKCWNVKTFECIKTFQGHENSVMVVVQLNDFYIASGDIMGFIKIWSLRTSLCYHTIQPYKSKIWYMSLNLPFLITCGEEDSIFLWRLNESTDAIPPSKERIKDQMEIDSLLASNNYVNALYLCLKLDMPFKSLEIVNKFSENIIFKQLENNSKNDISSSNLIEPLFIKIIKTKGSNEFNVLISSLCHLIRICISNSKISNIGNLLLKSILKYSNFDDLNLIFSHLKLDELSLVQSKHYNRIFQMAEKAWLLDLLILDCGDLQVSKTMEHLNRN